MKKKTKILAAAIIIFSVPSRIFRKLACSQLENEVNFRNPPPVY